MKATIFAILTSICWTVGSFFEKKGLHLGNVPPIMGITIRTGVAIIILGIVSYSHWNSLMNAGTKALLYLIIGGGVIAGSLGMAFYYYGIGTGELSKVIPIAFGLTPLLGYILGVAFMKEPSTILKLLGVIFTCIGVMCITIK